MKEQYIFLSIVGLVAAYAEIVASADSISLSSGVLLSGYADISGVSESESAVVEATAIVVTGETEGELKEAAMVGFTTELELMI